MRKARERGTLTAVDPAHSGPGGSGAASRMRRPAPLPPPGPRAARPSGMDASPLFTAFLYANAARRGIIDIDPPSHAGEKISDARAPSRPVLKRGICRDCTKEALRLRRKPPCLNCGRGRDSGASADRRSVPRPRRRLYLMEDCPVTNEPARRSRRRPVGAHARPHLAGPRTDAHGERE